jgi:hypothetical protein
VRTRLVLIGAFAAIAGAQGARELANDARAKTTADEPLAPSPGAAPIVSLGYRELAADLLFFRLVGYFGGSEYTAGGVAALVEAIVAMDPRHPKGYEWGGRAIVASRRERGLDNAIAMRAIRVLEIGAGMYPDNYNIPMLAGQIYLFDLETKDEAERRRWNEQAARLIETAVRRPNAPAGAATLAAHLRSKLGQHQRAVDSLREMMLITTDERAREELLEKLAELEHTDSAELAAELVLARRQFEATWKRERPSMRPSMYLVIGPIPPPGFDMGELATGGHDLIDLHGFERLESPSDPAQ